ncbi:NAD-dependent epimerase/dehydratase family protein [Azospirillaceae bacterium]
MAKIAVTGGSGFIGSHVVDTLLEAGHTITVIDHCVKPHRCDVSFEDIDILDLSSVLAATKGMDYVFHLAAMANVNDVYNFPVSSIALNIIGTANVLEAARQNGIHRIIFASTVWVYNGSPSSQQLNESSTFYLNETGHIYTSTKISAEMLCHNYNQLYKLPFTILRYGIPYGPRMREELLIPIFLKKALNGKPLTISGKGDQFRKFVYARDLANAHLLAMKECAENQTYNLEGTQTVTVLDVAKNIQKFVGSHVSIEFTPERPGDFSGRKISAEKAAHDLGWRPTIDFENGLRFTAEWFCEKWKRPLRL